MVLVMCPPLDLPRTVIRTSGRRHAELFRVMQTSALPRRNIRVLRYESVSIEGTLVTTVTRLATCVVSSRSDVLSDAVSLLSR
jgi:hypothetical protein